MTAQQLADLMPDATQLESNELEMESSLHYAQLALQEGYYADSSQSIYPAEKSG